MSFESAIRIGAQLGDYRIEQLLGRGGMGAVFLAHDTILHRKVALKIIDDASDRDVSRTRLIGEARTTAALNHPNICTIHAVINAHDVAFIAMEYIDGQSVSDALKLGALPRDTIVEYGRQAAEGLAFAHEHGVLHRDFKAANAMVSSTGTVKIVDFGLGRRRDELLNDATTMVSVVAQGTIAGTPYAMAPEQVRGEITDPRTDVWALGVFLYEMAAGRRPFVAPTIPDLFSSILRDAPPALEPDVPDFLASIIAKCLEKDPARRYASATDVRDALSDRTVAATSTLRHLSAGDRGKWVVAVVTAVLLIAIAALWLHYRSTANTAQATNSSDVVPSVNASERQPRRSMAILGFENISGRKDVSYISTALDQGLGSELSMNGRMRMVPGEDVSQMKEDLHLIAGQTLSEETLRKIQSNYGVDMVVTGSFVAAGQPSATQIRVDLRVQDCATGQLLGALSATKNESDLLALIAESGASARRAIGIADSALEPVVNNALPTSLGARQLYAEGLNALRRFDAKQARDLFERSIAQEPDFALGHVALANAWAILGFDAQAAREAAAASNLSRGLSNEDRIWIEGLYREYTRDWNQAINAYRTLVHDFHDQPEYVLKLADAQTSAGRPKEAMATLAEFSKRIPSAASDARLLLSQASAAEALGDATQLEKTARTAIDAAERQGARLLVARASIGWARALQLLGNRAGATETNEKARQLFEQVGDRRGVARALIQLGTLSKESGDLNTAERTLRKALDISREIGNKRQTSQSLNELANVFFRQRQFALAATMYDESVTISRELGDQGGEARALGNLASVRYEQGDVANAQRLDQQALTIKRAIGDQRSIAISLINIAETATDMGKLDEAQAMYEESRGIGERLTLRDVVGHALIGLARNAMLRDHLEGAQDLLQQARSVRQAASDAGGVAEAEIKVAQICYERGDRSGAFDALVRVDQANNQLTPEQAAQATVIRARLLADTGKITEAHALLTNIGKRSVEGYSAATGVDLQLTEARLLAGEKQIGPALAKAAAVAQQARARGLLAFELQAILVRATIGQIDPTAIANLIRRARDAKLALIARQAESISRR